MNKPIDLYLDFDENFFGIRRRELSSVEYLELLTQNKEVINEVLSDPNSELEERAIFDSLDQLAKNEPVYCGPLNKFNHPLKSEFEQKDLLDHVGLELNGEQNRFIIGRLFSHLTRMILPHEYFDEKRNPEISNNFPETFGRAMLEYFATTPTDYKESLDVIPPWKFGSVAGGEGHYVHIFWTLAPYIHANLKEKGLSSLESAEKIVNWAVQAFDGGKHDYEYHLPHARNLGRFYAEDSSRLGLDERMPSHLSSRLTSRVIKLT